MVYIDQNIKDVLPKNQKSNLDQFGNLELWVSQTNESSRADYLLPDNFDWLATGIDSNWKDKKHYAYISNQHLDVLTRKYLPLIDSLESFLTKNKIKLNKLLIKKHKDIESYEYEINSLIDKLRNKKKGLIDLLLKRLRLISESNNLLKFENEADNIINHLKLPSSNLAKPNLYDISTNARNFINMHRTIFNFGTESDKEKLSLLPWLYQSTTDTDTVFLIKSGSNGFNLLPKNIASLVPSSKWFPGWLFSGRNLRYTWFQDYEKQLLLSEIKTEIGREYKTEDSVENNKQVLHLNDLINRLNQEINSINQKGKKLRFWQSKTKEFFEEWKHIIKSNLAQILFRKGNFIQNFLNQMKNISDTEKKVLLYKELKQLISKYEDEVKKFACIDSKKEIFLEKELISLPKTLINELDSQFQINQTQDGLCDPLQLLKEDTFLVLKQLENGEYIRNPRFSEYRIMAKEQALLIHQMIRFVKIQLCYCNDISSAKNDLRPFLLITKNIYNNYLHALTALDENTEQQKKSMIIFQESFLLEVLPLLVRKAEIFDLRNEGESSFLISKEDLENINKCRVLRKSGDLNYLSLQNFACNLLGRPILEEVDSGKSQAHVSSTEAMIRTGFLSNSSFLRERKISSEQQQKPILVL